MTSVDDIYEGGKALKATDLKGHAVKVKISGYDVQKFDNGNKLVLRFEGKEKTLVCNKTNALNIAATYGKNPEGWAGKTIELYPDKTMFGTDLVDCIRVRVLVTTPPTDSEIPF